MAKIVKVEIDGVCHRLGVEVGDELRSIDNKELIDILDFYYYDAQESLNIQLLRGGKTIDLEIVKDSYESLGIEIDNSLNLEPIRCKNKCKFCFVDQLPKGMRETLYVKDDDYRLSFISGNYITLTNCSECELQRIVDMRFSPLYVSVHATNPEIKTLLVANPEGGKMLSKLRRLTSNGISVHAQIVLCPDINDGDVLKQTVYDLYGLGENMKTIACVPVGLTKYRDDLYPLKSVTKEKANEVIDFIEEFNNGHGGAFVWASDEFYIRAERELPNYASYGDFEQIENGVGLVRAFEFEMGLALDEIKKSRKHAEISMLTGVSFGWFLKNKLEDIKKKFPKYAIDILEVTNEFFGDTITVSGLVTAGDIIKQYKGRNYGNVIIPSNMLREFTDTFLDGVTVSELEKELNAIVHVCSGGEHLIQILKQVGKLWRR